MGPKLCQTASHQQLWTMASHDQRRYVECYSVLPWHSVVRRCIIRKNYFAKMEVTNRERGGRGESAFLVTTAETSVQYMGRKKYFCLMYSLFHLRKKRLISPSWFGFAWGCDRTVRNFMGHCFMIHWVIGFRPVLIVGEPEPKNLGGFLRALFSTIQQNGIWSASASRHSRRPSQFRGP